MAISTTKNNHILSPTATPTSHKRVKYSSSHESVVDKIFVEKETI